MILKYLTEEMLLNAARKAAELKNLFDSHDIEHQLLKHHHIAFAKDLLGFESFHAFSAQVGLQLKVIAEKQEKNATSPRLAKVSATEKVNSPNFQGNSTANQLWEIQNG